MPTKTRKRPCAALLSACAAILTACATPSSPTPPVVVEPPKLPPPAVRIEPVPSGTYWAMVCDWLERSQKRLSVTLPKPERCGPSAKP